jgi:xanthine dehydrogenase accessory factor
MIVLIRGAGDLASGVALRLQRCGLKVVMTELEKPLAVRRKVSFAQAVYSGEAAVEEVSARRVADPGDSLKILQILAKGQIPILIDEKGSAALAVHPSVIVDARMTKRPPEPLRHMAKLYIGLGPGFIASENCSAVIETNRGHFLGRVIWKGATQADTGLPDPVHDRAAERVLRAPADGELIAHAEIGDHLEAGQPVAEVAGQAILAPFQGVLRGLVYPGLQVTQGLKIGDVDPRDDPRFCSLVSEKSLALGGSVLEAILSRVDLRRHLWD